MIWKKKLHGFSYVQKYSKLTFCQAQTLKLWGVLNWSPITKLNFFLVFCLRVYRLLISGSYLIPHLTRCSTNLISNHHLLYYLSSHPAPHEIFGQKIGHFYGIFRQIEGQQIRPPSIVLGSNYLLLCIIIMFIQSVFGGSKSKIGFFWREILDIFMAFFDSVKL